MATHPNEQRTLTHLDFARLSRLDPDSLPSELLQCLDIADIVPSEAIPSDVVTMNSRFMIKQKDSNESQQLTLCSPQNADAKKGYISVLSPAGASFLGLTQGGKAYWKTPQGSEQSATVTEVLFQPESEGMYLL